jgi:CRISPR-associated protein Cas1
MPIEDLRALPRFEDGLTFVYVEYVRIEQEDHALVFVDVRGRVPVPVASLAVLLCGPGTTVTHAAVVACAENGCTLLFCGERGVRLYAAGLGETRSASNLLVQARFWADPLRHQAVVERMYRTRFDEPLPEQLTLQQLRGREGVRVRDTYARESLRTGVPWTGRRYKVEEWERADPINRALSTAHACLYGLCHAAIVSTGFSTALGFVHTGKNLAFVYDVADLYKATVTIPAAFDAVAAGDGKGLDGRVRRRCRDLFREAKLIERIVPDLQRLFDLRPSRVRYVDAGYGDAQRDDDQDRIAAETAEDELALLHPVGLWDPSGEVSGGVNHAPPQEPVAAPAPAEDDWFDGAGLVAYTGPGGEGEP